MRYWQVLVKSVDGRQFYARTVALSESRAILHGNQALPAGMECDLQIIVPAQKDKRPVTVVGLRAKVGEVVFTSGIIRLDFSVKMSSEAFRQLIESR